METGLYIHVPFCVRKCEYCDFPSAAGQLSFREAYIGAVCDEIHRQAALCKNRRFGSIFFGGGTPSLLSPGEVETLLDAASRELSILPDAEITMEMNPGTVTRETLSGYRKAGVNRCSLGIQSLEDRLLREIGRIHSAAQAEEAVHLARSAGFENLNMDLMTGLPGQHLQDLEHTLKRALSLHPEHLSVYSLIVEEGTPLSRRTPLMLPEEEEMEEMDAMLTSALAQAGLARYEVSNYARPGRECRHNLLYWECGPYLGVGPAAHSDLDGRFQNPSRLGDWLAGSPAMKEGDCTPAARRYERLMMGVRMVRGMDRIRFTRDFGQVPEAFWPQTLQKCRELGLIRNGEDRLALTPRGMDVMNPVLIWAMEEQDAKEEKGEA